MDEFSAEERCYAQEAEAIVVNAKYRLEQVVPTVIMLSGLKLSQLETFSVPMPMPSEILIYECSSQSGLPCFDVEGAQVSVDAGVVVGAAMLLAGAAAWINNAVQKSRTMRSIAK